MTNLNILQLNTSNANWETKALELLTTIESHNTDICIVPEANADTTKAEKVYARNNMFKNYHIEVKTVNSQSKARIALIIKRISHTKDVLNWNIMIFLQ